MFNTLALENEVTLAVVPSELNNSNVVVPLVFLTVNISSVVTATESTAKLGDVNLTCIPSFKK